MEGGKSGFDVT